MGDVVQIGDARFQRKHSTPGFPPAGACKHLKLTLDDHGDTVQCDDCKVYLSPYWALKLLTMQFQRAEALIAGRRAQLEAETAEKRVLLATRKVDRVWRSRNMVPACPHCGAGIWPEDNLGATQVGKDYDLKRRAAKQPHPKGKENG